MPKERLSTFYKRVKILEGIADYVRLHGYAPTWQELADAGGFSKYSVHDNIQVLAEQGYLTCKPRTARSLQLTAKGVAGYVPEND